MRALPYSWPLANTDARTDGPAVDSQSEQVGPDGPTPSMPLLPPRLRHQPQNLPPLKVEAV